MAGSQSNQPAQPTTGQQAQGTGQQTAPPNDPLAIPPVEIKKMMKTSLYDATYAAWMNTHFEADKTIIAVSSAGIGLLVTLLSVVEVSSSFDVTAYKLAISLFIIAIVCGVIVFKMNAKKLEKTLDSEVQTLILQNPPSPPLPRTWRRVVTFDKMLTITDWTMMLSFFLAVLCTAHIGITTYEIKAKKALAETTKPKEQKSMTIENLHVGSLTVTQLTYSTSKKRRK